VEDIFGLVVVMMIDYATGLLSYKERRYFLRAPVLDKGLGKAGIKCDGGYGDIM